MMADPKFLNSLIFFEKDSLKDKEVNAVKKYLADPNFTVENLKNVSTAGAGLLKWVCAMVNYYGVAARITPMRNAVMKAEKDLMTSSKQLAKVKADLQKLSDTLERLRSDLAQATAEKEELKRKTEIMARQLEAASKLIVGLGSEKERWSNEMTLLDSKRINLIGDCLLTSSFLSYLGAFSNTFRQSLTYDKWIGDVRKRKLPLTEPFRLETLLTSEVEIIQWASESLPSDELSIQNGILTTRASRFPLCIDPQMQAVTWIKRKEGKDLDGRVKTFNDADFLKHLEMAITFGFPFLFENVDEYIDPVINPVLEKNIIIQGARRSVKLGDKDVDWDPSFRLYLTSRLSNPHYTPEVFGKTMVINYSVTQQGLQAQLLNVVVGHERADLEAERLELIQETSKNKAMLKKLEDTLLKELANATGNILDNEELISTLERVKEKAVEIAQKLEQARVTAEEIEVARSKYQEPAKRGSILFFAMSSLSAISSMYEYSLASFLGVFVLALERSKRDPELRNRLNNIINTLTENVTLF